MDLSVTSGIRIRNTFPDYQKPTRKTLRERKVIVHTSFYKEIPYQRIPLDTRSEKKETIIQTACFYGYSKYLFRKKNFLEIHQDFIRKFPRNYQDFPRLQIKIPHLEKIIFVESVRVKADLHSYAALKAVKAFYSFHDQKLRNIGYTNWIQLVRQAARMSGDRP